jgi:hypothetical protein
MTFKRAVITIAAAFSILSGCFCKGDSVKEGTATVIGKGIEVGKGVGAGIGDGIEKGRKDTVSADGSKVLSTPEEIFAACDVGVHEVQPAAGAKPAQVVLAVTNKTDKPVHLIGLDHNGGAQVFDTDGFAVDLKGAETIVVPPNAKVKTELGFTGDAAKAAKVRVWGKDLPVPGK